MKQKFVVFVLGLFGLISLVLCADEDSKKKEEAVLKYKKPDVHGFAYIAEPFDNEKDFRDQWIFSQAKKDGVEATISKYDGQWVVAEPTENTIKGDKGLILKEKAKHHAISTLLPTKFDFEDQPLIVQYEVKFQNNLECGGAYMKLLSADPKLDLEEFTDKSGYTIMFGPDKCGEDSKLHFIFRHMNPTNGKFEEKHAKKPTGDFSKIFDDKKTHLFTLTVKPDNTFEIRVDKQIVNSGSLLSDVEPPVNPSAEIDDPSDKKPEDWDEREKIVDPIAKKPEDWDEDAPPKIADPKSKKPDGWLDDAPENVPDPNAVKPVDWDEEEDGEWEAPQIPNPKCAEIGCGEWKAPMIDNPSYKGKWAPPLISNPAYKGKWQAKKIQNPDFFEDKNPFKMTSIGAVGFELWSMTDEIVFDNIIISSQQSVIDQWTADTWDLKYTKEFSVGEGSSGGLWNALMDATKERPWLWAVYIAVIFLPIILIFACCFPSKKDDAAEKKKTDEPTADDEAADEPEENVEEEKKDEEEPMETDEKEKEDKAEDAAEEVLVRAVNSEIESQEVAVEEKSENPTEKQSENELDEEIVEVEESEHAAEADLKTTNVDDDVIDDQIQADLEPKEEPQPEPEEDIPPPDASPRTRASRRRARKE